MHIDLSVVKKYEFKAFHVLTVLTLLLREQADQLHTDDPADFRIIAVHSQVKHFLNTVVLARWHMEDEEDFS